MSAVQTILYPAGGIILIQPTIKNVGNSASGYPYLKASHLHASASCKFLQDKSHPRLIYNTSKNKRSASVLVFGKGDSMSDNEELLKKAPGSFRRGPTVQDLLREYAKKKQFGGNGGGGNSRSGGDGSGGQEGEGISAQHEELLQVILATIGVLFLYVLITRGEELTLLCRDYINYLLGAKASARLIRTLEKWRR